MTRDSNAWWVVMGLGILGALASDASMVNDLTPDRWETQVHAVIKLLSLVVVGGAGVARMSPLPISAEGRAEAIQKKTEQLTVANVIAIDSSIKADKAVAATKAAADAAVRASEVSEKAADG